MRKKYKLFDVVYYKDGIEHYNGSIALPDNFREQYDAIDRFGEMMKLGEMMNWEGRVFLDYTHKKVFYLEG